MIAVDRPDAGARSPSFFLTHGAGGDLNTAGLVAFAKALAREGHVCVRANLPYRDAGRRSPPAAEKSVAGFLEIFDQARAQVDPGGSWVAGGRSYGGRVGSLAVAGGLEVAGLLFLAYPLHRPGDASQPRTNHWPDIEVPCLFIQGTNDPFCNVGLLDDSLALLGRPATLIRVEGGDHSLRVRANPDAGVPARSAEAVAADVARDAAAWARRL